MGEVTAMNRHVRRLILAGAFTAAGIAGWAAMEAADDTAAYAAPKKPGAVVEQPGGVLDHQLPTQASDRTKQVVDQVKPKPKPDKRECDKPHPPKPAPIEDTPADEPTKDKPHNNPPDAVPPVVDEPDTDPVVTLPADDPAPLPDADYLPPAPWGPAPAPAVPAVTIPDDPPLIGPTPSEPEHAATPPMQPAPVTAVTDLNVATCDELDVRNVNRDAIRALIDSLTRPAASEPEHERCASGPAMPAKTHTDCGQTAHSSAGTAPADLGAALEQPALARLQHTRPRSHLPASRHTCIEPGPA